MFIILFTVMFIILFTVDVHHLVYRRCSSSRLPSCLSTCQLCCSPACSCRLENGTAFFPLIFHYLEDKGLQGELWGMHMHVQFSIAWWWPSNMEYNITLNLSINLYLPRGSDCCHHVALCSIVIFTTYPFCFSVAVEMIANKLFQQFLDQMEAKVSW